MPIRDELRSAIERRAGIPRYGHRKRTGAMAVSSLRRCRVVRSWLIMSSVRPTDPRAVDTETETFRHILSRLRDLIPRSLLDGPAWDRLLDRTGDLPINVARFFGLEFRLGDPVPAADFIVRVPPRSPLAAHYIRQGKAAAPSSAAASLARYLTELRVGRAGRLFDLALEYDIAEVPPGAPSRSGRVSQVAAGRSGAARHRYRRACGGCWLDGRRGRAPDGWSGCSIRCRRAVEFVFLGALPNREVRAIRVMVEDIEESNVPAFLQRLDWPGPVNAVTALFSDVRDVVALDDFQIAIDVTGRGVLPHIGSGNEVSVHRPRWDEVPGQKRRDGIGCLS